MINNLHAVIAGFAQQQPVPRVKDDARSANDSAKPVFAVDVPEPKVRGDFDSQLGTLDGKNAANQAGNFQILLKEQQQSQELADAASAVQTAPYETATNAYTAAENAAQYARPTATYLGSI